MELYKRQQSESDTILTSRIFPNLFFQQSTVYCLHVLNVNQSEEHKLSGLFKNCKLISITYLLHPEASRIIYRPTSKHPNCILSTLNMCINRGRKVASLWPTATNSTHRIWQLAFGVLEVSFSHLWHRGINEMDAKTHSDKHFFVAAQSNLGLFRLIAEVSMITHRNTHLVGLLWTSDQLVAVTATYTTHNKHKRPTFIPSAGFESAILAIRRLCLRPHGHRARPLRSL